MDTSKPTRSSLRQRMVEDMRMRKLGWRQLRWPVDDNYLGRFDATAGQVCEAGLL